MILVPLWDHPDVVTLVPTWISPEPGDSGPLLGPTRSWGHWPSTGPHMDLVNLVPIWASPTPRDFVPHLDLIAVDSFLASPGTGDSDPNWTSPRSADSGTHLWIL